MVVEKVVIIVQVVTEVLVVEEQIILLNVGVLEIHLLLIHHKEMMVAMELLLLPFMELVVVAVLVQLVKTDLLLKVETVGQVQM
jgi:hypothetical protein